MHERSQISGDKSFNVYKKSDRQNQINKLRQSNSFYQINDKETMENLYKNSKFQPIDKNLSYTQGTNHHVSSSVNLGNNINMQNYFQDQRGVESASNNFYLENLKCKHCIKLISSGR